MYKKNLDYEKEMRKKETEFDNFKTVTNSLGHLNLVFTVYPIVNNAIGNAYWKLNLGCPKLF